MLKPAFLFDGRRILDHDALVRFGYHVEVIGKCMTRSLSNRKIGAQGLPWSMHSFWLKCLSSYLASNSSVHWNSDTVCSLLNHISCLITGYYWFHCLIFSSILYILSEGCFFNSTVQWSLVCHCFRDQKSFFFLLLHVRWSVSFDCSLCCCYHFIFRYISQTTITIIILHILIISFFIDSTIQWWCHQMK